jgi:hypothetical protein
MKKTRAVFGLEFEVDDCAALWLTVRELRWRYVDYGAFSAYFVFCAGWHCDGMSVEVRGRWGGALRRIAGLIWLEYKRRGGRALQVKFWRLYRDPHRDPELWRTYSFRRGRRPRALTRCV